jgi:hypothetical protein
VHEHGCTYRPVECDQLGAGFAVFRLTAIGLEGDELHLASLGFLLQGSAHVLVRRLCPFGVRLIHAPGGELRQLDVERHDHDGRDRARFTVQLRGLALSRCSATGKQHQREGRDEERARAPARDMPLAWIEMKHALLPDVLTTQT